MIPNFHERFGLYGVLRGSGDGGGGSGGDSGGPGGDADAVGQAQSESEAAAAAANAGPDGVSQSGPGGQSAEAASAPGGPDQTLFSPTAPGVGQTPASSTSTSDATAGATPRRRYKSSVLSNSPLGVQTTLF